MLVAIDRTPRGVGGWMALNLLVLVAYSALGAVIVLYAAYIDVGGHISSL